MAGRNFNILSSVCIHVVNVTIYIKKPILSFIPLKHVKKNVIRARMSITVGKLKYLHIYPLVFHYLIRDLTS